MISILRENTQPTHVVWIVILLSLVITGISLYYVLRYLETLYAKQFKKPFFVHLYIRQSRLEKAHIELLKDFPFYQKLKKAEKSYFEHRIQEFLNYTEFYGRDGFEVTDLARIQIAQIGVMLTFGMREYLLEYVKAVIIYPEVYFSVLNQKDHKGEFNPRFKSIAFSWEDFMAGNVIKDDRINLGIHEFTHAIHYTAIRGNDISSEIFYDTFLVLEEYLSDSKVRVKLTTSTLLRSYAYTDKFEFIAVLIEVFIESPKALQREFPKIYLLVRQMLNFRFAGY